VTQVRYERLVAIVYFSDGNVNEWMIEHGQAWAYREYLKNPTYCRLRHEGRVAKRGLWSHEQPIAPWEWRRHPEAYTDFSGETIDRCIAAKGRSTPGPADQPAEACRIKGNIGKSGSIYHVPGSASYKAINIDELIGERWFCSEADAQAAGWRPPS